MKEKKIQKEEKKSKNPKIKSANFQKNIVVSRGNEEKRRKIINENEVEIKRLDGHLESHWSRRCRITLLLF